MTRLQNEIGKLKKMVLALGAVAEEAMKKSVLAFETRNAGMAQEIIQDDLKIDKMEVELEEEGLKILALHQPVAIDLRFIVAVLRINSDLERIGDLAVNLSERALFLSSREPLKVPLDVAGMAAKEMEMLEKSLDALVNMDAGLAREVIRMDDEVDEMNSEMFAIIYDRIKKNPERAEALIHHLSATRHLERVADHATNIAEDVIYMVEGEIVRHQAEDFT